MEKISRNLHSKKHKAKLPTISPSHNSHTINGKTSELADTSSLHLKELRKLYYQYKSNATILTSSPYYTNRQHKHNLISYI